VEAAGRAKRLLADLDRRLPAERLRFARAAAVLEYLRTPDATGLLKRLADGAPGAWETEQATAAVGRIARAPGAS
jgi:hypothetical protein